MTIPYISRILLAGSAAVFSSTGFAYQPLITDDTGTQGQGGNQLEFAFNEDRDKQGGDTVRTRTLPLVYTRGLTDTLDAFVGVSHVRIRSDFADSKASGAGNTTLGLKWRFYENEASKTSLGLKPEIALPVSAAREQAGLGTGKTTYGLTLILTQEAPFGAIHANLGTGRERFRESTGNPDATTTHLSVAPVWEVSERWKLALDIGTDSVKAGGDKVRAKFVEVGAVFSPNKDLDFALGFIRSTDNADPETTTRSATAGVTWRFK